jgi:DNA-binding transcriptional ArsR family regulator
VGYAQKNKKIRFRLNSRPGLRAKVCYRSHGLQTSTTGFRFQEDFSRTSNSPQSPKLLVELERCDAFPPTVGELAEILTIERSALGQTLKPVERDGLIALSRDDHDRRRRPAPDIRWAGSRCPRSALLAEAHHHRFAGFFGEPEMTELRATLRDIAENPQVASAFDQGAASG